MKKSLITLLLALSMLLASCTATQTQNDPFDAPSSETSTTSSTTEAPSVSTETIGTEEWTGHAEPDATQSTTVSQNNGQDDATIPVALENGKQQETVPTTTNPSEVTDNTEPPATIPDATLPHVTEPPETEPPVTTTPETQPAETDPPETQPTKPENEKPVYDEAFQREVAYYAAYYINQYRKEAGVSACTILPGMTLVAEYRADQLTVNYDHDTEDIRAALAHFEYGRYVDATIVGLDASESYYDAEAAEAIFRGVDGNTAEEMGKDIADRVRDSQGHWNYVGSGGYSYIGIGVEYDPSAPYLWYGCIMVGRTNYG